MYQHPISHSLQDNDAALSIEGAQSTPYDTSDFAQKNKNEQTRAPPLPDWTKGFFPLHILVKTQDWLNQATAHGSEVNPSHPIRNSIIKAESLTSEAREKMFLTGTLLNETGEVHLQNPTIVNKNRKSGNQQNLLHELERLKEVKEIMLRAVEMIKELLQIIYFTDEPGSKYGTPTLDA